MHLKRNMPFTFTIPSSSIQKCLQYVLHTLHRELFNHTADSPCSTPPVHPAHSTACHHSTPLRSLTRNSSPRPPPSIPEIVSQHPSRQKSGAPRRQIAISTRRNLCPAAAASAIHGCRRRAGGATRRGRDAESTAPLALCSSRQPAAAAALKREPPTGSEPLGPVARAHHVCVRREPPQHVRVCACRSVPVPACCTPAVSSCDQWI